MPQVSSCEVAVESTFGSIVSTTGMPSTSGLTFVSLECDRTDLAPFGDAPLIERSEARDGFHSVPPELDAAYSSGTRIQHRQGTITLKVPWRGYGANGSSNQTDTYELSLFRLMNTVLADAGAPTSSTDTVSAASTANRYTPTADDGDYDVGQLFGYLQNGRMAVAQVTKTEDTPDLIYYNPSDPDGGLSDESLFFLHSLYIPTGSNTGSVGSSVCLRLKNNEFVTIAYGCRAESIELNVEQGRPVWSITMRAALIEDDHTSASAAAEPERTDGVVCHLRNTYVQLSAAASATDGTTPDELDSVEVDLDVDGFSMSLGFELTEVGTNENAIGFSDFAVTDTTVELSLTFASRVSTIASDLRNQTHRTLSIPFAPLTAGNGGAVFVPSAFLTSDPEALATDPRANQPVTYSAGRSRSCGATVTGSAGSPLIIGFGAK